MNPEISTGILVPAITITQKTHRCKHARTHTHTHAHTHTRTHAHTHANKHAILCIMLQAHRILVGEAVL